MDIQIKSALIGAIIPTVGAFALFFLGDFSTQSKLERDTVQVLSEKFDSVEKDMSYEDALQAVFKENEQLKNEISTYNSNLTEVNNQIGELQSQKNQEIENIKQQYENEMESKYNVNFQNINLIIDGIDTKYNDRVAIINDEKYYSMGFLQYLVDNEKISDNNKNLFIGNIQSEEQMPISLFDLKPTFSDGYLIRTTDEKDNYGNMYNEAFKVVTSTLNYDNLRGVTEYLVEKKYSKFSFDVVHSAYADQNYDYEIVIYGDNKQLKSIVIDKKTKLQHIEIDISDIEFLQIIGKGGYGGPNWDTFYGLIVNPYLYP